METFPQEAEKIPGSAAYGAWLGWYTARAGRIELPGRLYHFTDGEGLRGILSQHIIRACMVTSLNDVAELQHGVDIAKSVLEERKRSRPGPLLDSALWYLNAPPLSGIAPLTIASFCVSFCEDVKKSGPWLHYGRQGTGAALAFSTAELKKKGVIVPVEYDEGKQKALVGELIDVVNGALERTLATEVSDESRREQTQLSGQMLGLQISILAVEMKKPCFKDEDEWRLLRFHALHDGYREDTDNGGPIRFRVSDGRIVPYKEIDIPSTAVEEIVLGHSSPHAPHDLAIRMLARDVAITKSSVPLRP